MKRETEERDKIGRRIKGEEEEEEERNTLARAESVASSSLSPFFPLSLITTAELSSTAAGQIIIIRLTFEGINAAFKISARVSNWSDEDGERETRRTTRRGEATAMRLRTPFLITLKRVVETVTRGGVYSAVGPLFLERGKLHCRREAVAERGSPPEEHCAIATAAGASPFQLLRQKAGFLESPRNVKLCESGTPKRRKLKRSEVLE